MRRVSSEIKNLKKKKLKKITKLASSDGSNQNQTGSTFDIKALAGICLVFCVADIYLTLSHFSISDTVFHCLISISDFMAAGKNKPIRQEHCICSGHSKHMQHVVPLVLLLAYVIVICRLHTV